MPHFKNVNACKPLHEHHSADDWLKQDWTSALPTSRRRFFSFHPSCLQTQALRAKSVFYGLPSGRWNQPSTQNWFWYWDWWCCTRTKMVRKRFLTHIMELSRASRTGSQIAWGIVQVKGGESGSVDIVVRSLGQSDLCTRSRGFTAWTSCWYRGRARLAFLSVCPDMAQGVAGRAGQLSGVHIKTGVRLFLCYSKRAPWVGTVFWVQIQTDHPGSGICPTTLLPFSMPKPEWQGREAVDGADSPEGYTCFILCA